MLGKYVRLRPIESTDQAFITDLNSDPVVRSNVVGWDWPTSLQEQERWFSSPGQPNTRRWMVDQLKGGPIGLTGLWDIDWHNRTALTALKLGGHDAIRGRGFGTDAIMTVMAFSFYDVGLQRIHSSILANNVASLRAYTEKCGWTVEGTARRHVWRHGEYQDLLYVGILKEEFDALPDAAGYVQRLTDGTTPDDPSLP